MCPRNNRLTNRWTPVTSNTVYSYDAVGNLTTVWYQRANTSNSFAYDAMKRLTNMVDTVGTTVYSYDPAGQVLSEDGPWDSDTVSYTYQNRLRKGLGLAAPNASPWAQSYGYDVARRLTNVTSQAGSFTYLLAGSGSASPLVKKLLLPGGAYITNYYDGNARLLGTYLRSSGNTNLDTYDYAYNRGNQRTQQVFTAGNLMNYAYDNIGQLKTALGQEPSGTTNRMQEQLGYFYDAAGNLNYRTNNTLLQAFNVNNLNELTTVTNGGRLTVAGTTTSPATNVTVNTSNAILYVDATFASTNQSWTDGNNTYTAIAKDTYGRVDSNTVTVTLSGTNLFAYDLNGNMLTNSTRVFEYDDENQLIRITQPNAWKSEFVYDGKLRRRIRKEYTWNGSSWLQTNEVHYVYDGNLVIQERDGNNVPQVTYTWGTDLSGSLQGAGGIGGLLARTANPSALFSTFAHAFYHADGNGNITYLIYSNQRFAANYQYDPYGNILNVSGPLSDANSHRFASEEYHSTSGLTYYLYRYYEPKLQRWVNRDPSAESGILLGKGLVKDGATNPFTYVQDDPLDKIDRLGLSPLDTCCCDGKKINNWPIKSGVKKCTGKADSVDIDHGWLEIDGGWSADFVSGESIWGGKGVVRSPTDYANPKAHADTQCEELLIYPCQTDVKKFQAAIKSLVAKDVVAPPIYNVLVNNCFIWDRKIIDEALNEAAGCTAK
jgi:RHS repeat-associated protein